MTVQERILLCMLLESIQSNKKFARKAGLKDKTYFRSERNQELKKQMVYQKE